MNELTETARGAQELWDDLRARLEREQEDIHPRADVVDAAGLFDLLSDVDRGLLANFMYDELRKGLRDRQPLQPLHRAILALVNPYFINQDIEFEARVLLSKAFRNKPRPFEDELAIAHGLIDLSFRVPGSEDIWSEFYTRHSANSNERYDALDAALSGLATWNIIAFQELVAKQPAERWLIDRIAMFVPTLTRKFTPAQVSELVGAVYSRCNDAVERDRLSRLANAYSLVIKPLRAKEGHAPSTSNDNSVVDLVSFQKIPEWLIYANRLVSAQRLADPNIKDIRVHPTIHIYRSAYTGNRVIDDFQSAVIEKIRELANSALDVTSSESDEFAELSSSISLSRKVIFAFPTYLTSAKRNMGYCCASFGKQRRIGILIPEGNQLYKRCDELTTVEDTLRRVKRDGGKVFCVRNYAIHEIVRQIAETDPDLEQYFDERHLRPCERRDRVPVINEDSRNFVFMFDLAGWEHLSSRSKKPRTQSTTSGRKRSDWIVGAKTTKLSHSATIEVGVAFSKHLVEWLLDGERWFYIASLVSTLAGNRDFISALSRLGVDVDATLPPKKNSTEQQPPRHSTKENLQRSK